MTSQLGFSVGRRVGAAGGDVLRRNRRDFAADEAFHGLARRQRPEAVGNPNSRLGQGPQRLGAHETGQKDRDASLGDKRRRIGAETAGPIRVDRRWRRIRNPWSSGRRSGSRAPGRTWERPPPRATPRAPTPPLCMSAGTSVAAAVAIALISTLAVASIRRARPPTNAWDATRRAAARMRPKVWRETPICRAASTCSRPTRSVRRSASRPSSGSTRRRSSSGATPTGLNSSALGAGLT